MLPFSSLSFHALGGPLPGEAGHLAGPQRVFGYNPLVSDPFLKLLQAPLPVLGGRIDAWLRDFVLAESPEGVDVPVDTLRWVLKLPLLINGRFAVGTALPASQAEIVVIADSTHNGAGVFGRAFKLTAGHDFLAGCIPDDDTGIVRVLGGTATRCVAKGHIDTTRLRGLPDCQVLAEEMYLGPMPGQLLHKDHRIAFD